MPIYEYSCPQCGLKFELLCRPGQAGEDASCPRCRNNARRILSSFSSFARGSDGQSTPIGGSSSCGTCSATSCDSCKA